MDVRLEVEEGPRSVVGTIAITGSVAVPAADLRTGVGSREGQAVLPAAGGARPGRHPAAPPQSRVSVGHRRGPRAVHGRPHARGPHVRRQRRPAGLRGSRPHRGQRPDQHRDHPPRADAGAGRAAQLLGSGGEPEAAQRARAVPPRAGHRARSRRAEPPRRARVDRGSADHHDGLWRRRRGRPRAPSGRARRSGDGSVRGRASRVRGVRAAQPVREEPVDQRVRPRHAAVPLDHHGAGRGRAAALGLRVQGLPPRRHVPRASRRRHRVGSADDGVPRTGRPFELRLHAARRAIRAGAPPEPAAQRVGPLCDRARQGLRRALRPGRSAAHRSAVPAGAAVDALGLGHPRHARRPARAVARRAHRRGRRRRRALHRIGSGLHEALHAGLPLPAAARPPRRHLRRRRAGRAGHGLRPRRRRRWTRTAIPSSAPTASRSSKS